jgi:hypothetical protein
METDEHLARSGHSHIALGLIGFCFCRDRLGKRAQVDALEEGIYAEFAGGVGGQFE